MPWRQSSVCAFNAFHISTEKVHVCYRERRKKWTVCRYRFYPPEFAKDRAGLVCPSVESQPVSPPPAAASPASFPGIHRLLSPHTHPLSETSQSKSLSLLIQRQKKKKKFLQTSLQAGPCELWFVDVLGSVCRRTTALSALPASAVPLFVNPETLKKIDLFQGSVTQKGMGSAPWALNMFFFFFFLELDKMRAGMFQMSRTVAVKITGNSSKLWREGRLSMWCREKRDSSWGSINSER